MKENYRLVLDRELEGVAKSGRVPSLLLHACCAPCSSYVLEYLSEYFYITLFFYNPNISSADEYEKRAAELRRLAGGMPLKNPVKIIEGNYEPERFSEIAKGMEDIPEGGERCFRCYEMRLRKTAALAAESGFDYFTTTLSISPHKNAMKLNEIGGGLADEFGVDYLYSDFKKRGGYKRSCELSAQYGLYRQNYCGCIYSMRQAEQRKERGGS